MFYTNKGDSTCSILLLCSSLLLVHNVQSPLQKTKQQKALIFIFSMSLEENLHHN